MRQSRIVTEIDALTPEASRDRLEMLWVEVFGPAQPMPPTTAGMVDGLQACLRRYRAARDAYPRGHR